jgi:hypothetical protein
MAQCPNAPLPSGNIQVITYCDLNHSTILAALRLRLPDADAPAGRVLTLAIGTM